MRSKLLPPAVAAALCLLAACADEAPTAGANLPPAANAGADQVVASGAPVTLTGGAVDSDGSIAAVDWEQVSGPAVSLGGPASNPRSFVAPTGPAELTFRFTATDDQGATGSDTMDVNVLAPSENQPPQVSVGNDRTAAPGETITLTGTATDPDGQVAAVAWSQAGAPGGSFSSPDQLTTDFTAPGTPTELTLTLTATDDDGATTSRSLTLTVETEEPPPSSACLRSNGPHLVRTDLAAAGTGAAPQVLLRFLQFSDEHIMDEDGQAVNGGGPLDPLVATFESAMRFQDEYTDEVLNAMIVSANACHAETPMELMVSTGDNTDLGTVAEVRRLISNFDGVSGIERRSRFELDCEAKLRADLADLPAELVDPLVEFQCTRFTGRLVADSQTAAPDTDDPLMQFLPTRMLLQTLATEQAAILGDTATKAPGLPPVLRCNAGEADCANVALAVPYYVAFGNHDGYVRGTLVTEPGVQEASLAFGRHYMRLPHEFITEFFETEAVPGPVGHGFNHVDAARWNDADPRNDSYYAFDAGNGRFRMVVLNTIIDGTDPRLPPELQEVRNPFALAEGTVDPVQFEWLKGQLAAARTANQLVLVFSHHPDVTFAEFGQFPPPLPPLGVSAAEVNAELASYPNVVAWVAGHTHRHRIRAFKVVNGLGTNGEVPAQVACKGPAASCTGFWQIETASHVDFPQEARILEIRDNGNGTGTIRTTVIGHGFETSRALAERDDQCQFYLSDPALVQQAITDADLSTLCGQGGTRDGEAPDRNVDLLFRMPPAP